MPVTFIYVYVWTQCMCAELQSFIFLWGKKFNQMFPDPIADRNNLKEAKEKDGWGWKGISEIIQNKQ